ncbi:MAG: hypothetical protein JW736_08320 [Deltaproteobacteria bacterium]|nr:hypothetical protein [Deltaproteobacteria bacterium]MBN2688147.1 hypothetical protein [Deltaproteobacteria bacterium]
MDRNTDKPRMSEISLDSGNMYREELFTDMRVGSIRRLTPVNPDGSQDHTRKPIFIGQTQLVSHEGSMPFQCHIDAKNIKEALDKFSGAMNQALETMFAKLEEMKREEESRIVVPGSTPTGRILAP